MSKTMLMPLLSKVDPKVSEEGAIDPLGMYAIADSLAVRMIPGVRERQTRPRFLTSMAVSLSLCGALPEETVAADWDFEDDQTGGIRRGQPDLSGRQNFGLG